MVTGSSRKLAHSRLAHWRSILTLGPRLEGTILHDLKAFAQLANDAAILFIDQYNLSTRVGASASLCICLARLEITRIVRRELLRPDGLGARRRWAVRPGLLR